MKTISYLECVKRVLGDNIILCNNIAYDSDFNTAYYETVLLQAEAEAEAEAEKIESFKDLESLCDYWGIDLDIDSDDLETAKESFYNEYLEMCISNYNECYQYYLCNPSESDLCYNHEVLKDALTLVYYEKLDLYVLCVFFWGISWDLVGSYEVED